MSLGGGSGWATIGMSLHTGELAVLWSGNHTQNDPATIPLVVIDMYEHAYALDYGAGAQAYVDAVFANLDWALIDRRYELARKAREAMNA
jgi:Fe-Mn family superoxide dismutase